MSTLDVTTNAFPTGIIDNQPQYSNVRSNNDSTTTFPAVSSSGTSFNIGHDFEVLVWGVKPTINEDVTTETKVSSSSSFAATTTKAQTSKGVIITTVFTVLAVLSLIGLVSSFFTQVFIDQKLLFLMFFGFSGLGLEMLYSKSLSK